MKLTDHDCKEMAIKYLGKNWFYELVENTKKELLKPLMEAWVPVDGVDKQHYEQ